MNIEFCEATKEDIDELIRMRIEYMIDDFGSVSDYERECMEKQLVDYFNRKLGTELIAFTAKSDERIVSVAYLHIIEMPANPMVLNGLTGKVLSVFTEPEYRGRGLCTKLMEKLVEYGQDIGLAKIDLGATKYGYPVYKKVGFTDADRRYTQMTYKFYNK